jgi:anti-anti-sigma factor
VEEAVYYKSEDTTIFIKATGHVTALVCPQLKAEVFARLEAEPTVERIYLELSGCEYMDSTFLGLIVGTQKRFAKLRRGSGGQKALVLLNTNEACIGLLRTIGVLGLVELSDAQIPFPSEIPRLASDTRASARFLLDAHEELVDLSDENRKRFSALTSVLRSAVDAQARPSEDSSEGEGTSAPKS